MNHNHFVMTMFKMYYLCINYINYIITSSLLKKEFQFVLVKLIIADFHVVTRCGLKIKWITLYMLTSRLLKLLPFKLFNYYLSGLMSDLMLSSIWDDGRSSMRPISNILYSHSNM